MAENGIQFAASLHQMGEDLLELAANGERNRKTWKTTGLAAEQKVADLEQTMRKSKTKYDSLADEYDRARTGEGRQGGGKVLGAFKAHKSAAQQEEDLLRKVQNADQTYSGHVQALQAEKAHLVSSMRPETVKALRDIVTEVDAGLTLQMQKFAAFNEKLLLGNGVIVYPFKNPPGETAPQPRSMRQAVSSVNNDRDLKEFLSSHRAKVQHHEEIKYERNPVLNPPASAAMHGGPIPGPQAAPPPSFNQPSIGAPQPLSMGARTSTGAGNFPQGPPPPGQPGFPGQAGFQGPPPGQAGFQGPPPGQPGFQGPPSTQPGQMNSPGGMTQSYSQGLPQPGRPFGQPQQQHNRAFSQGSQQPGHAGPGPNPTAGPGQGPGQGQYGVFPPPNGQRYGGPGGPGGMAPPQGNSLPFHQGARGSPGQNSHPFAPPGERRGSGAQFQQAPPPMYGAPGQPAPDQHPTNPVFHVTLGNLYERDGLAVPMVVEQCIQAVDLYGLGVEGIYRQSGSLQHINKLKAMFNQDSKDVNLEFTNPENFFHDVNSVTGLLKQFFRDLPDPLLTREHHGSFIAAASTYLALPTLALVPTNVSFFLQSKTTTLSAATRCTPSSTACLIPTTRRCAPSRCTSTASWTTLTPTA